MSIAVTVSPKVDHEKYVEVERGIAVWYALDSVSGDATSGQQAMTVEFNPNSDPTFARYWAVTRFGMKSTGAARTKLGCGLDWDNNQFERTPYLDSTSGAIVAGTAQFVDLGDNEYQAAWNGFVNFGRGARGLPQRFGLSCENVNTAAVDFFVEGLVSEHPILGRWWLSA